MPLTSPALAQQVLIDARIVPADFFGRMSEVEPGLPGPRRPAPGCDRGPQPAAIVSPIKRSTPRRDSAIIGDVGIPEIQAAFDDVFDQAMVFHGFADYMRDYEVFIEVTAGPRTGISPRRLRYRFILCVQAEVRSVLPPETWKRSLDERLLDAGQSGGLDGYVWGVRWQELYPGMSLVPDSSGARRWAGELGRPFHEAVIRANAHCISLVFSDLAVSSVDPGHAPFTVPGGGPDDEIPIR